MFDAHMGFESVVLKVNEPAGDLLHWLTRATCHPVTREAGRPLYRPTARPNPSLFCHSVRFRSLYSTKHQHRFHALDLASGAGPAPVLLICFPSTAVQLRFSLFFWTRAMRGPRPFWASDGNRTCGLHTVYPELLL